jgi:hypothetical protein
VLLQSEKGINDGLPNHFSWRYLRHVDLQLLEGLERDEEKMTREDIIRMAREAGFIWETDHPAIVSLAELAYAAGAAAERNKVAQWIMARGYSTGHGDTVEDLLKELNWQVREEERELCAQQKPWVKTYAGGKPNYITPEEQTRQWQGLRGEEIHYIASKVTPKMVNGMSFVPDWAIPFGKEIEAKLREKNHG